MTSNSPRITSILPDVLARESIARLKPTELEVFKGGPSMREGLIRIGMTAIQNAQAGEYTTVVVGITDKGRQNPINSLGGKEQAGDAALSAYWDMLRLALALTRREIETKFDVKIVDVPMMRVSARSDEGNIVFIASGERDAVISASAEITRVFERNLDVLRDCLTAREVQRTEDNGRYPHLRDYTFNVPMDLGAGVFKAPIPAVTDLGRFGTVLQYADMVISLTHRLSRPIRVSGTENPDFLLEAISRVEEEEIAFRDNLPPRLRISSGRADAASPFSSGPIVDMGISGKLSGTYFEIKLAPSSEDAIAVSRFIRDKWDEREASGTRKGMAEVLGFNIDVHCPEWGMRILNTMLGKAATNAILTAISEAVYEVANRFEVLASPVDGSFRYYIEGSPPEGFTDAVGAEIEKRMQGLGGVFGTVIRAIDAASVEVEKVARAFELLAMGKTNYGVEIIEKTNFLVNFIEIVKSAGPNIQRDIVSAIDFEVQGERLKAVENIAKLRTIFAANRTIRDTQDLVAVLRNEPNVNMTRDERKELEDWFFDFANTHAEDMKKSVNELLYRPSTAAGSSMPHSR